MPKNMGKNDQLARFVAAFLLAAPAFIFQGLWSFLFLPALLLFLTASVRFCPVYAALGMSTCPHHRARRALRRM